MTASYTAVGYISQNVWYWAMVSIDTVAPRSVQFSYYASDMCVHSFLK